MEDPLFLAVDVFRLKFLLEKVHFFFPATDCFCSRIFQQAGLWILNLDIYLDDGGKNQAQRVLGVRGSAGLSYTTKNLFVYSLLPT